MKGRSFKRDINQNILDSSGAFSWLPVTKCKSENQNGEGKYTGEKQFIFYGENFTFDSKQLLLIFLGPHIIKVYEML